jgi:hypothetical protein
LQFFSDAFYARLNSAFPNAKKALRLQSQGRKYHKNKQLNISVAKPLVWTLALLQPALD